MAIDYKQINSSVFSWKGKPVHKITDKNTQEYEKIHRQVGFAVRNHLHIV